MNKNKNIIHNQKHLTLSDRTYLEQELVQGSSFKSIADVLQKDPSTIAKEIKRARIITQAETPFKCHGCMNYHTCEKKHICGDWCNLRCRGCYRKNPIRICKDFVPWNCDQMEKPPYVCNHCDKFKWCKLQKAFYNAAKAQASYEKRLSASREGINMTPEELSELNDLISPLVMQGQPLSHIFAVHSEDIPVCRRTLYNYFDQNVFKARNIDLPRRVRYKKRKKQTEKKKKDYQQTYRNKRTYVDFERFMAAHPDTNVVEMDTVKGSRAAGKCLLTLLFRSCSFMLVILLPDCTQRSVVNAINNLTTTLGIRTFQKYFPVILTDNGSEFKNPWDIEKTEKGTHRTYMFYCDPYVSNQKARLEKNHEYIRYIIPKGRSMHKYTQEDINLMASHINSTARDSLNGSCPFDLAALLLDKKIPLLAGQFKVSPDEVMLKPVLLENRVKEREGRYE